MQRDAKVLGLYNKRGWKLKLQPQGWRRLLSYNFFVAPLKASGLQHRRSFAQRRHCAEEKKTPLIKHEPKIVCMDSVYLH